ncbi:MAG TPA: hypothetical protein PKN56_24355 [Leptospiraceae bacterium]|nr:hypothetical protein [Leptospiraceae bacterium]
MKNRFPSFLCLVSGFLVLHFIIPLMLSVYFPISGVSYATVFISALFTLIFGIKLKRKISVFMTYQNLIIYLTTAIVFFLPFVFKGVSVFTEAGGDIGIYLNYSKKVPNQSEFFGNQWTSSYRLYEKIFSKVSAEIKDKRFSDILKSGDMFGENFRDSSLKSFHSEINESFPPFNWEHNRVHSRNTKMKEYTGWILPQSYINFLFDHHSNLFYYIICYIMYYIGIFSFFLYVKSATSSLLIRFFSVFLLISAHAYVSVPYNHFYPAWMSNLFLLTVILSIISRANINVQFFITVFSAVVSLSFYWPFSVFFCAIFLFLIILNCRKILLNSLIFIMGINLFISFLIFPFFWGGLYNLTVSILSTLILGTKAGSFNADFLGVPHSYTNLSLYKAILGYLHLGNIPPYSSNYLLNLKYDIIFLVGCLVYAVLVSYLTVLNYKKYLLSQQFMLLAVYLFMFYIGKNTLYTQYKAFSYGLLIVYILPFTLIRRDFSPRNIWIISSLIFIFSLTLFSYRIKILQSIVFEENRESFVPMDSFDSITSDRSKVYIIEPHNTSAIFLLDSLTNEFKHMYSREYTYFSLIGISHADVLTKYNPDNFIYVKKEKQEWKTEPFWEKLEREKIIILGPGYISHAKVIVEAEIILPANQSLKFDLYKTENCVIPKVKIWDLEKREYIPYNYSTFEKEECKYHYEYKGNSKWNSILIEGRHNINFAPGK